MQSELESRLRVRLRFQDGGQSPVAGLRARVRVTASYHCCQRDSCFKTTLPRGRILKSRDEPVVPSRLIRYLQATKLPRYSVQTAGRTAESATGREVKPAILWCVQSWSLGGSQ